jgi:hypothetical protein
MNNSREPNAEDRLREVDYSADSWSMVCMDIAKKLRADNPQTTAEQAARPSRDRKRWCERARRAFAYAQRT